MFLEVGQLLFSRFYFVEHVDFLFVCKLKASSFGKAEWWDQLILHIENFLTLGKNCFLEKQYFILPVWSLGYVFLHISHIRQEGIDFVLKGLLLVIKFVELLIFQGGNLLKMWEALNLREEKEGQENAKKLGFGSD